MITVHSSTVKAAHHDVDIFENLPFGPALCIPIGKRRSEEDSDGKTGGREGKGKVMWRASAQLCEYFLRGFQHSAG